MEERWEGDKDTKGIMERKEVRDEDTKKIFPVEFQRAFTLRQQ
jgi:hypothetical protein